MNSVYSKEVTVNRRTSLYTNCSWPDSVLLVPCCKAKKEHWPADFFYHIISFDRMLMEQSLPPHPQHSSWNLGENLWVLGPQFPCLHCFTQLAADPYITRSLCMWEMTINSHLSWHRFLQEVSIVYCLSFVLLWCLLCSSLLHPFLKPLLLNCVSVCCLLLLENRARALPLS